jgi:hypothetical protein
MKFCACAVMSFLYHLIFSWQYACKLIFFYNLFSSVVTQLNFIGIGTVC